MDIISLILSGISIINFILAMIIILLIASCFLGRNIKITRNMIISACMVVIFVVLVNIVFLLFDDKLLKWAESIVKSSPIFAEEKIEAADIIGVLERLILDGVAFLFAFIFYLIAFKEHRLLRAIEATVCLYGYYLYIQNMIQGSIVFIVANKDFLIEDLADLSQLGYIYTVTIIADFIIDVLLLLLLYFGYYRKKRYYIIRVPFRIMFVIWVIVSSALIMLPMTEMQLGSESRILSLSYGIIIPIVCIVAPIILVTMAAERSLREKNEYQENYLKAELDYIEQYKRTQTQTRAFRHDMINNLSLAKMMLDEGRVEEANAHISELLGNVRSLSPQYVTGDEMLDLIVSMKAGRMQENGIRFALDGVADGGLNMKPMDCCSIFANALDNALEAAALCDEPFVDMSIKRTPKFFVIKISNSCSVPVNAGSLFIASGYTSKSDKEHHGFGLRNIKATVDLYNGIVNADYKDGVFVLSIMVPRSEM